MHVEKIIGPSGTGKTETLIRRVEAELGAGVRPERLGYYSFTRAAAPDARRRAREAFPELDRASFIHFRTLHSEAFQLLGWTRDSVMTDKPAQNRAVNWSSRWYRIRDNSPGSSVLPL